MKIDKQDPTALNVIGVILMASGKLEDAVAALTDAGKVQFRPDAVIANLRQKEYVSKLYLYQAYMKLGKIKEANAAAESAFHFDPTEEAKKAMEEASKRVTSNEG